MRAVVQRVRSASVDVDGERISEIAHGLVVLLGVGGNDRPEDGERLARKVADLRIFAEGERSLQRTVLEVGGAALVVPQFTLYADVRKGRRPDLAAAAPPEMGRRLFDAFCGALRGANVTVETGRFGAAMRVRLEGDGPVTIVASTDRWSEGEL